MNKSNINRNFDFLIEKILYFELFITDKYNFLNIIRNNANI